MPDKREENQVDDKDLKPPTQEEEELNFDEPEVLEGEEPERYSEMKAREEKEKKEGDKKDDKDDKKKDDTTEDDETGGDDDKGGEGEYSAELLLSAKEVGLTVEDLKEFGGQEAAEKGVALVEKHLRNLGKAAVDAASKKPPADKKEGDKKDDKTDDKTAKSGLELKSNEEEIDAAVVGDLKTIVEHVKKQDQTIAELRGELEAAKSSSRVVEDKDFDKAIDAAVASLGDVGKELFGEKPYSEMTEAERAAHKEYNSMFQEMLVVSEGRASAKLNELDAGRLFNKTFPTVFPKKVKAAARKEISDKLKNREKQFTQRPTKRKTKDLKGEELAIAKQAKRMKDRGDFDDEDKLMEGLPD